MPSRLCVAGLAALLVGFRTTAFSAAARDTVADVNPAPSHLLWMSTGDITPNNRPSLGLHEFVVPSIRFSFLNAIQVSVFNAAFSSDFLLGVKVRIFHSGHGSVSIGYDVPVGDPKLGGGVSYWYGAASIRFDRVGIHTTMTREREPAEEGNSLNVQAGMDVLLRTSADGSGLLLLIESICSQVERNVRPFPFLLAGVRIFRASAFGDVGVYVPLEQGTASRLAPVVSLGILF